MPSKPRISKSGRQLHRFYEPLVLLAILNPSTGRKYGQSSDISYESQEWQSNFLDQLAWICDFKCGGVTVSAVAAEARPSGPIYWLAAPGFPSQVVRQHLESILQDLRAAHASSETNMQTLEEELTSKCVAFSRKKVQNYRRMLTINVGKCKTLSGAREQWIDDDSLLANLEQLIKCGSTDLDLCRSAYEFRFIDSWEQLARKKVVHNENSAWSDTRHYIGRLGSWTKAAKVLVRTAAQHPDLVDGCCVNQIPIPAPTWRPEADSLTTLESAVKRMLPAGSEENATILGQLQDIRLFDVASAFRSEYNAKTFKPRIHAETALMEHFHQNALPHLNDHRYIGCSKPSCYSCDLYIRYHPGHYIARSCHGNVWKNWCFPLLPSTCAHGPIDHHTRDILNLMTAHIRSDLKFLIKAKACKRRKLPDSTTGISNVPLEVKEISEGPDPARTLDTKKLVVKQKQDKTVGSIAFSSYIDAQLYRNSGARNFCILSNDPKGTASTCDSIRQTVSESQFDLLKGKSKKIDDEDENEETILFHGRRSSSR